MRPPEERFWKKVIKTNTCWNWIGANCGSTLHGLFYYQGRLQPSHRVSYEWVKGLIPEGLHIDHLCRNPACVNPDHLEAVTPKENILRGVGAGAQNLRKTHCIRGHELSKENIANNKKGYRICLRCRELVNKQNSELLGCNKPKTHCPNGHEYTPDNSVINSKGYRICRACKRLAANLPPHKDRTQCKNGHEYKDENTYMNSRGIKECRICRTHRSTLRLNKLKQMKQKV